LFIFSVRGSSVSLGHRTKVGSGRRAKELFRLLNRVVNDNGRYRQFDALGHEALPSLHFASLRVVSISDHQNHDLFEILRRILSVAPTVVYSREFRAENDASREKSQLRMKIRNCVESEALEAST
jgi:hypothetical protein